MRDIIEFMLQSAVWPFLVIVTVIPCAAIFGQMYRAGMERAVFNKGSKIKAKILYVSVDEGYCNVHYRFIDPNSGKWFVRNGVLGFQMENPPVIGDHVRVKYLPHNPKWSRMVDEIHLVSA